MAKGGQSSLADIVIGDIETSVHQSEDLASQDHGLHSPWTCTIADKILYNLGSGQIIWMGAPKQTSGIADDMRGYGYATRKGLHG